MSESIVGLYLSGLQLIHLRPRSRMVVVEGRREEGGGAAAGLFKVCDYVVP